MFLGSRVGPQLDPLTFAFSPLALALPLVLIAALLSGGPAGPASLLAGIVPVAMIVVTFNLGYLMQLKALRLAPPTATGLVFTLEPVVAIATAVVALDEKLVAHQFFGSALVLVGVAVAVLSTSAQAGRPKGRP